MTDERERQRYLDALLGEDPRGTVSSPLPGDPEAREMCALVARVAALGGSGPDRETLARLEGRLLDLRRATHRRKTLVAAASVAVPVIISVGVWLMALGGRRSRDASPPAGGAVWTFDVRSGRPALKVVRPDLALRLGPEARVDVWSAPPPAQPESNARDTRATATGRGPAGS